MPNNDPDLNYLMSQKSHYSDMPGEQIYPWLSIAEKLIRCYVDDKDRG